MKNWTAYHHGFATHAATGSKDAHTQVGAALIGPANEVRLTGYNDFPIGVANLPERRERPAKYLFTNHAEAAVIAFAARNGIVTGGCTIHVTHFPCSACARLIIQAGIVEVVYGAGTTSMPDAEFEAARIMFEEAGVKVRSA